MTPAERGAAHTPGGLTMRGFGRAYFRGVPGPIRAERCRALTEILTRAMRGAVDFHARVRELVDELRAAGHDLWSWDLSEGDEPNDTWEIWGPDYGTPTGPGILVTFRPDEVCVEWTERFNIPLQELVATLEHLNEEHTIYVRRPWTPTSDAQATATEDYAIHAQLDAAGLGYFLKVTVAKEAIRALKHEDTVERRTRLLIHYAQEDSYPDWVLDP